MRQSNGLYIVYIFYNGFKKGSLKNTTLIITWIKLLKYWFGFWFSNIVFGLTTQYLKKPTETKKYRKMKSWHWIT